MGVPADVVAGFARLETAMDSVRAIVEETLRPFALDHRYVFFGRSKSAESLAEKFDSGRFPAWSAVEDYYACTIVVPTASHEADVIAHLGAVFDVIEVRSRDTRHKPPDVFRFDTTRVIGRLKAAPGLDRPTGVESLSFEVQIPSVFQYAWGVVTRDLTYKSDSNDWQRLRLVAQLKAAVEQIETVIGAFEATAGAVIPSGHKETDAKALCLEKFVAWYDEGLIPTTLKPYSWTKFAENIFALVSSYSGRRRAPEALEALLTDVESRLRGAPLAERALSGSLFQLVVGLVGEGGGNPKRHLHEFPLIDSVELRDLYGVSQVPKPIAFDLPI